MLGLNLGTGKRERTGMSIAVIGPRCVLLPFSPSSGYKDRFPGLISYRLAHWRDASGSQLSFYMQRKRKELEKLVAEAYGRVPHHTIPESHGAYEFSLNKFTQCPRVGIETSIQWLRVRCLNHLAIPFPSALVGNVLLVLYMWPQHRLLEHFWWPKNKRTSQEGWRLFEIT